MIKKLYPVLFENDEKSVEMKDSPSMSQDQTMKIAQLEAKVEALSSALRWYVENDETYEGGKWEDLNHLSLQGKRRAMKLLGMPTSPSED